MRLPLLYTTLVFLLFTSKTHAQFIAHCTIYNEDNLPMTVFLDGEKRNDIPASRVRIINLTEQAYKLKIVFADTALEPIIKYRFELQDSRGYPADRTFIVKKNRKGYYNIHWKSETPWPGYIKPVKQVAEQKTLNNQTSTANKNCTQASLEEEAFLAAKNSLTISNTDSVKMMQIKQIIITNCMTSAQIKSLLDELSEESNKLEVAKMAYASVVDKGNYFMVNNVFKNPASIEELYKYILK